jgi:hypothetical protein
LVGILISKFSNKSDNWKLSYNIYRMKKGL